MSRRPYNVLFLCTGNSARSIMAEAALHYRGGPRFRAFSAGSHPKAAPHPMALEELRSRGLDSSNLHSKSWEVFAKADAPALDFVFTVCDNARGEGCPVWPGQPVTAHWGVEDPADFDGPREAQRRLFQRVYTELEKRIEAFTRLPLEGLDPIAQHKELDAIGRNNGSDSLKP